MGTPVPIEEIEIDPDLWYKVTVQIFFPSFPDENCTNLIGPLTDCVLGSDITAWIDSNKQCTFDQLASAPPGSTQKIESIGEAFPNEAACRLAL